MAKCKCVICGEYIDGESIPYKNRKAHPKCFNIAIKAVSINKSDELNKKSEETKKRKPKPKAELKDAVSEEDYQKKKDFYAYIRSYYEDENGDLPVKVYAVSEHQIKSYGYTFEQMHQTLVYIREILEKDVTEDGVGLIPYYFTEAMGYYKSLNDVAENNKDKNVGEMYRRNIVRIKPRPRRIIQLPIETIGVTENGDQCGV